MKLDLPFVNHWVESERKQLIDSLIEAACDKGTENTVVVMSNFDEFALMSSMFRFFNESLNYPMSANNQGSGLGKKVIHMRQFGEGVQIVACYSHACASSHNGSFVSFSLVLIHDTKPHEVCSCSYVAHPELGVHRLYKFEGLITGMLELPSGQRREVFGVIPSFFDFIEGLV